MEMCGDRGGSELARLLTLPAGTWYNYEMGVTVPAEVILHFIEVTGVEPKWLMRGLGDKYRYRTPGASIDRFQSGRAIGGRCARSSRQMPRRRSSRD